MRSIFATATKRFVSILATPLTLSIALSACAPLGQLDNNQNLATDPFAKLELQCGVSPGGFEQAADKYWKTPSSYKHLDGDIGIGLSDVRKRWVQETEYGLRVVREKQIRDAALSETDIDEASFPVWLVYLEGRDRQNKIRTQLRRHNDLIELRDRAIAELPELRQLAQEGLQFYARVMHMGGDPVPLKHVIEGHLIANGASLEDAHRIAESLGDQFQLDRRIDHESPDSLQTQIDKAVASITDIDTMARLLTAIDTAEAAAKVAVVEISRSNNISHLSNLQAREAAAVIVNEVTRFFDPNEPEIARNARVIALTDVAVATLQGDRVNHDSSLTAVAEGAVAKAVRTIQEAGFDPISSEGWPTDEWATLMTYQDAAAESKSIGDLDRITYRRRLASSLRYAADLEALAVKKSLEEKHREQKNTHTAGPTLSNGQWVTWDEHEAQYLQQLASLARRELFANTSWTHTGEHPDRLLAGSTLEPFVETAENLRDRATATYRYWLDWKEMDAIYTEANRIVSLADVDTNSPVLAAIKYKRFADRLHTTLTIPPKFWSNRSPTSKWPRQTKDARLGSEYLVTSLQAAIDITNQLDASLLASDADLAWLRNAYDEWLPSALEEVNELCGDQSLFSSPTLGNHNIHTATSRQAGGRQDKSVNSIGND